MRAGALQIPVGEESVCLRVVELIGASLVDVTLLVEAQEDILGYCVVVWGAGGGVEIPVEAQRIPLLDELGVIPVDDHLGLDALLLCSHRDRRAVDVGSRDHERPVADGAVVPGEDVGGEVGAGNVPDVA